jgi:hypothetical protein
LGHAWISGDLLSEQGNEQTPQEERVIRRDAIFDETQRSDTTARSSEEHMPPHQPTPWEDPSQKKAKGEENQEVEFIFAI